MNEKMLNSTRKPFISSMQHSKESVEVLWENGTRTEHVSISCTEHGRGSELVSFSHQINEQQESSTAAASNKRSLVLKDSKLTTWGSPPLKKPRIMDYSYSSNSNQKSSSTATNRINFPNFLIPELFLKSPRSLAIHKTSSLPPNKSIVETTTGDCEAAGLNCSNSAAAPPDKAKERTVAAANDNNELCNEPHCLPPSSSLCSLGASNDPNISIRIHDNEDSTTDDSSYFSDNDQDNTDNETMASREAGRVKRSRINAEVHNLSERKRRGKINKRIRTLKQLIPNCNKKDKASMLDDAIEYLKTLKLQLQIMSLGNGLCMPYMMLPGVPHHHHHHHLMNAPHLQLPPNHQLMGGGICFRPGLGTGTGGIIPCNIQPQFPIQPSLSAITDMFGNFSNQTMRPPINPPIPHLPFIPPPPSLLMPTNQSNFPSNTS